MLVTTLERVMGERIITGGVVLYKMDEKGRGTIEDGKGGRKIGE